MGNMNLRSPPTPTQMKGLHWARSLSAVPSLIGATVMIQHILRSKLRRSRTISRILLGMSTNDLLFGMAAVFGTLFNPKGAVPNWVNPYAIGTWKTCEASGFILQASSTASVLYNGNLALCYLLTLRYGWKERQLKKIELYMHLIPHIVAISMSAISIHKGLYNPTAAECRIQEYPEGCLVTGNCIRGDHADDYGLALFFSWVWGVFVFLCVSMFLIYQGIRETESKSERRSIYRSSAETLSKEQEGEVTTGNNNGTSTSTTNNKRKKPEEEHQQQPRRQSLSTKFANQACFYCIVYFFTWIFGTVNVTIHERVLDYSYIPIIFLLVVFEPLVGFFNMCVYFRPRFLAYYRQQRQKTAAAANNKQKTTTDKHRKTTEEASSSNQVSSSNQDDAGVSSSNQATVSCDSSSGPPPPEQGVMAAIRFTFSVRDIDNENPGDEEESDDDQEQEMPCPNTNSAV